MLLVWCAGPWDQADLRDRIAHAATAEHAGETKLAAQRQPLRQGLQTGPSIGSPLDKVFCSVLGNRQFCMLVTGNAHMGCVNWNRDLQNLTPYPYPNNQCKFTISRSDIQIRLPACLPAFLSLCLHLLQTPPRQAPRNCRVASQNQLVTRHSDCHPRRQRNSTGCHPFNKTSSRCPADRGISPGGGISPEERDNFLS